MPKKDRTGRRVQIYLPADLLEQWERTPRYERSATVAQALRAFWGAGGNFSGHFADDASADTSDKPH